MVDLGIKLNTVCNKIHLLSRVCTYMTSVYCLSMFWASVVRRAGGGRVPTSHAACDNLPEQDRDCNIDMP